MSELLPVNIVIADRSYRIKIEAADEEMVRRTANLINDKITEFRGQFAGKDMQDYVSMVLLWFATDNKHSAMEHAKWQDLHEKLASLEKMVDKGLESEI
jgi:cell division protein ZapA (FtsZ GTPase activity inhibitor)